jgi:hypothetical protein
MLNQIATSGTHFPGATSIPGVQYLTARPAARPTYHPSRKRSPFATAVIKGFCAVVSSVMVTGNIDRNELFEKYDLKLWSYEDQLTLFTIATIPSVVALAAIYVAFRGIQGFRLAFFLQN